MTVLLSYYSDVQGSGDAAPRNQKIYNTYLKITKNNQFFKIIINNLSNRTTLILLLFWS